MKPRAARRKVMLGARMRCGATWGDAAILNISSGGVGLAAVTPPPQGAYIELRRGAYVVVARVVWASGERFGVLAQDSIAAEELVAAAAARSGNGPVDEAGPRRERRQRREPPTESPQAGCSPGPSASHASPCLVRPSP